MDDFSLISTAAVIGDPIAHSLSPKLHTPWLNALDGPYSGDGSYAKIHVNEAQLADFVTAFRASTMVGFNATSPHKEALIPLLDRLSPAAKAVGSVNTVVRQGDQLVGYTTDGIGWLTYLRKSAPQWNEERPVIMIGAGGAARAILHMVLSTAVPMVMVANRSAERAQALVDDLGRGRAVALSMADIGDASLNAGLMVNTTTLGMAGKPALHYDVSQLPPDAVVNDIVYNPLETPLIADAQRRGLKTVDGLGMLIYQGAAAFKLWFGVEPKIDPDLHFSLLAKQ